MKIDINNLKHFHEIDGLVPQTFGDAKETACLMSALTGATNFRGCVAAGWPRWLVELGAWFFDTATDAERYEQSLQFATAVRAAQNADFDAIFREIRLDSILPIAMEALGQGDEQWRIDCRAAVQWCIDNSGAANPDAAWAAGAAVAAEATWAKEAAVAAEAAWAAGTVGAVWAAGAVAAVEVAGAAARCRIFQSTIKVLRAHADKATKEQEKQE